MSKEIKEILQEDIDEVCVYGYYSVARAYTTLVSARQKIEQLEKEVEDLRETTKICCDPTTKELLRLEQENTKLKERVKELEVV